MTILNSADFRNNFAQILNVVVKEKKPVLVGRFGQPRAVLVDVFTYNWQNQVVKLLGKIKHLTKEEIETLNILLDEKARNSLFSGLKDLEEGQVTSLTKFMRE